MRSTLFCCAVLILLVMASPTNALVCGDINGDSDIDISDLVYLAAYIIGDGPSPTDPWDANVDLCNMVDVGDLTYLCGYLFSGYYPPCSGGADCGYYVGGRVEIDHVDGLLSPGVLATGVPITFHLRYINNTGVDVYGLTNGYTVSSPEGAIWQNTSVDTVSVPEFSSFPIFRATGAWGNDGQGEDTLKTLCMDLVNTSPPGYGGMPAGFSGIPFTITIGPLSSADAGKSIVIDSASYDPAGLWKWSADGKHSYYPNWGGPYRYFIGYRPSVPAFISIGQVHNSVGTGLVAPSTTVTFDLFYQDSMAYPFQVLSNGFKVYSSDGATWTESHGVDNGIFTSMFDGGVFVNGFSNDGSGSDTIGFGALTYNESAGMPPGFVGNPFSIVIGPITYESLGKTICVDSSWYPPINNWIWGSIGQQDIFPDWYGPYCYTVTDTSELVATLAPLPDTLFFSCYEGGSDPSYNYMRIVEMHGASIPFSVANTTPWVHLDKNWGSTPDSIFITLNASGMPVGPQFADLTVTADSALNSPQVVVVRLDVLPVPNQGIVLDRVGGGVGADQIRIDTTINFDFRVINNSMDSINGAVHAFRIYSPNGATWTQTSADTIGLMRKALFDLAAVINLRSPNGINEDSVMFGFVRLNAPGLVTGLDDVSLRISIGPINSANIGKTICVDSTFMPPANQWIWANQTGNFTPAWGGPYCFTIVDAPALYEPPPQPTSGDSLVLPLVAVAPGTGVQPVMVKLSQAIKGATVPLRIPAGVTVSAITRDSLITEGWDYTFTQIKPDSGFIFVALANSFGARIPAGTSEIFRIHFSASNPSCAEYRTIRWDTTLMGQVSRQLTFADTTAHPVYPGFSYLRDSLLIMPFLPGDCSGDNQDDVGDLVCLVDFMFNGAASPININAVDNNGDCIGPDIADLVYLVDYQFVNGPEPVCGCIVGAKRAAPEFAEIVAGVSYEKDATVITVTSPVDLRGIEFTLEGAGNTAPVKLIGDELDVLCGNTAGGLHLGILDLNGANTIAAGETRLVKLPGIYRIASAVVAVDGSHSVVPSIVGKSPALPDEFELYQNYPNPFNPTTEIGFALPQATDVRLEIFNIMGQRVKLLVDQPLEAGIHTFLWDGKDATGNTVASGVYLYRLDAGTYSASRKMLLLK